MQYLFHAVVKLGSELNGKEFPGDMYPVVIRRSSKRASEKFPSDFRKVIYESIYFATALCAVDCDSHFLFNRCDRWLAIMAHMFPTYNNITQIGFWNGEKGTILVMVTSVLDVLFGASQQQYLDSGSTFASFNNETGAGHFIVPNIIHLVRFSQPEFSFIDYICIQAAFRNHRPDHFYIHSNEEGRQFRGKYWDLIERDLDLRSRIRILPLEPPSEIFGQQIDPHLRLYHGGDIARIRTMMKYGGIYLDNDVYVIKNLDTYRRYEMTINWDEDQFIGTQVIIANRDARFLPMWLDSYREYHPELWYYNAGERPTIEILYRYPELIHRVKVQFGADIDLSLNLYRDKEFDWRPLDTIHLMINHRMDPHYNETPSFDENVIKTYPYPFGEMAREMVKASGMENLINKTSEKPAFSKVDHER